MTECKCETCHDFLQARVKELIKSKQHEFECFQKVNSELTKTKLENAKLRRVVDAAREYVNQPGMSCYVSEWHRDAERSNLYKILYTALRELDGGKEEHLHMYDDHGNCTQCNYPNGVKRR